jgi:hypothetical protein
LGSDFSGRVLKAPADSGYAAEDIAAGYIPTGSRRPFRYGAHQPFLAIPLDSGIFKDVRRFKTVATADAYRLFLDILTALPKEPLMCFCWVGHDRRAAPE